MINSCVRCIYGKCICMYDCTFSMCMRKVQTPMTHIHIHTHMQICLHGIYGMSMVSTFHSVYMLFIRFCKLYPPHVYTMFVPYIYIICAVQVPCLQHIYIYIHTHPYKRCKYHTYHLYTKCIAHLYIYICIHQQKHGIHHTTHTTYICSAPYALHLLVCQPECKLCTYTLNMYRIYTPYLYQTHQPCTINMVM